MNRSVDYELRSHPSLAKTEEKLAYTAALACLLVIWAVFSLATVMLMVEVLIPGHLGLSALLQALGNLLPADFPMFTTNYG